MANRYNLNDLIYHPHHCAPEIKHPVTGVSYPVNKNLFELYTLSKNGQDIAAKIEEHQHSYNELATLMLRDYHHKKMAYEAAQQNAFQIEFDEPNKVKTEFYVVVNFHEKLRDQVLREKKFSFHQYLEIIEYMGTGEEVRTHSRNFEITNDVGNQSLIANRWNKDHDSFVRIASESSIYTDLNEAKEHSAMVVYNVGNLLNGVESCFALPTELIESKTPKEIYELVTSFGVVVLFKNYQVMKAKYNLGTSNEQQVKQALQRELASYPQITEYESERLLVSEIMAFKNALDSEHGGYWRKCVADRMAMVSPSHRYYDQATILLGSSDSNSQVNYDHMSYFELVVHRSFVESVYLKFARDGDEYNE